MTIEEFSSAFDTLVAAYANKSNFGDQLSIVDLGFDEYEKSVFLTQAQEEIVVNLYNGKNPYGDSFESTEETRRYLDSLVKTKSYNIQDSLENIKNAVSKNSIFFKLPEDVAFITYEQVKFNDEEALGCYNGSFADVYPVTQDEYNRLVKNPFRGPTKYRVLRMDTGDSIIELISKYNIEKYLIKYFSLPTPIILTNLPGDLNIRGESQESECRLNPVLHETILKRAVQLAITSKSINSKVNSGK